jgi:Na+-driven multidrug efflux pump
VLLGLAVALIIAALTAPQASTLLRFMGGSEEVVLSGSGFTRVMLGGNATVLLLFMLNAVFRGSGDAAVAMRVLWLGNILNIILGPCFIFGLGPFPRLGVTAPPSPPTSDAGPPLPASSRFCFAEAAGSAGAPPSPSELRVDASVLRLSGSGTIQILIGTASYIGLVRILSVFGSPALAGYTIGMRVIIFAILPAYGVSNAAATMVGQNLGAGRPDRAERAVWTAAFYNMIFLGIVGLVFLVAAPLIASLFTNDPGVKPYAIGCLRTVSLGFLFYAYGLVLTQAFNGAGDTWTPTVINLFVFWLWEIPLAWWLSSYGGLGARGVFMALTIAYSTLAVVSAILFRRESGADRDLSAAGFWLAPASGFQRSETTWGCDISDPDPRIRLDDAARSTGREPRCESG